MRTFILALCLPALIGTTLEVPESIDIDDYQQTLPQPPVCPFGFQPLEDESAQCEPVEFEKGRTSAFTIEDREAPEIPDVEMPKWNLRDFGIWMIIVMVTTMLVLVILYVLRRTRSPAKITDDGVSDFVSNLRETTGDESHQSLADLQNFDAAIHALLLDIIERIFREKPELNKPSITAREISNAYSARPAIHDDLAKLILRVELSRFARVQATLADYQDASLVHERLVTQFGASYE